MTQPPVVRVQIEVGVDPLTAFTVFTEEIDAWWVRSPYAWNDAAKAVGIRIEPGVGGRWIEVHDAETGEGFEIGRVAVWEPGERLVCSYRDAEMADAATEVELRFEASGSGTRVTLEHRGWEMLDPDFAARKMTGKERGWGHVLTWFAQGTTASGSTPRDARVVPYLMVGDLDAAIDWLVEALGLRERFRLPGHAELDLDGATIMLGRPQSLPYGSPRAVGGVSQMVYAYVQDVDARWRKALAAGAEVVEELGDRAYGHRNFTVADPDGHQWCFAESSS